MAIWIVDDTVAIQFIIGKLTLIDFAVKPLENSFAMHKTLLKRSCIFSSLCGHDAMAYFEIFLELSYVFALTILHSQLPLALHVASLEAADVDFPIGPLVDTLIIILDAICEHASIDRTIRVCLNPLAIGLVIHPLALVAKSTILGCESALAGHFIPFEASSLQRAVRVNK